MMVIEVKSQKASELMKECSKVRQPKNNTIQEILDTHISKLRQQSSTNLLVKECVEEVTLQKVFRLPLFPLFEQFKINIYDLQGKESFLSGNSIKN